MTISIVGLDKALVLAALYNAARPQGMGFMQYDPAPMTREEADAILSSGQFHFDYLKGRVMKVALADDSFDPWGYDRDNGSGAAAAVIEVLKVEGTGAPLIRAMHEQGRQKGAAGVMKMVAAGEKTRIEDGPDGVKTMYLGLDDDIADVLVERAKKFVE